MKFRRSNFVKILIFVYLLGAVLYVAHLGWAWISEGSIPDRPLWMHLLAPVVGMALWMALEALGTYVGNGFTFDEGKPAKWRRAAGMICLFVLLVVVIVGGPMYQMSRG